MDNSQLIAIVPISWRNEFSNEQATRHLNGAQTSETRREFENSQTGWRLALML